MFLWTRLGSIKTLVDTQAELVRSNQAPFYCPWKCTNDAKGETVPKRISEMSISSADYFKNEEHNTHHEEEFQSVANAYAKQAQNRHLRIAFESVHYHQIRPILQRYGISKTRTT